MEIRDWLADAGTWRWARMLARRRLRRDDVEDVVQRVALRAWMMADDYRPARGSMTQWLGTILRSETASRWREIGGHPGRSAAEAQRLGKARIHEPLGEHAEQTREPSPAERAERRDEVRWLREAIDALPGPIQEAVRMSAQGMTSGEIGRLIGRTRSAVSHRLMLGIGRMRAEARR